MSLQGLKVLDFTTNLPGPYASMLLADLGARVIKIENPAGGDPTRKLLGGGARDCAPFLAVNRSKLSLAVNLKTRRGREVIHKLLAAGWENWLEGFRPGVMARLGLEPAALLAGHPRLIMVSITGYGQDGPRRQYPGHDAGYLARSGLLYATGSPGGPPAIPALPIADLAGGALPAVVALLTAVIERERSGKGRLVDLAMCDSLFSLGSFVMVEDWAGRQEAKPGGAPLTGRYPCYRVYRTADDRHVVMSGLETKFWNELVTALDRPDLAPRQYDPEAIPEMEAIVAGRDFAWWCEFADRVECCLEPVLTPREARDSRQARERCFMFDLGDPCHCPQIQGPPLLPGQSPRPATPAPTLGQHTWPLLRELGYEPEQIRELARQGVVSALPETEGTKA